MHLHSEFLDPPSSCRPTPFWFWNGKLEKPLLVQQIEDMHEKGIGGFFIHARFGLDTPYLSPEWMDCVKAAIDAASKFDMEVWLYDEANFPSGLSDLKVTARPEFRSHFVELTEIRVEGPDVLEIDLSPGRIISAVALRCENGSPSGSCQDLGSGLLETHLAWEVPDGEWLVMIFVMRILDSPTGKVFGVDYMNPDATKLFIETTHEVYARDIGEHFGKTVKGFFVDEPTLLPWHHDISWYGKRAHPKVVVWSPCLEEELQREGVSAPDILPHLFLDLDETTAEKRSMFYRVVSRLYVDSFFIPYKRWCDEHGLLLTGHLLLEEGLYCNTIFQADPVPALAAMHVPGTDHLGLGAEGPYGGWSHLPKTMTNAQGQKLVSSVSHLASKARTLSETFGCAGWGLSLEDMKRITDWQYGLGINFMCPHALFYSIEGYRKADAPPAHNRNASWPYYRLYSDYVGRLSLMLRGGTHVCRIAVVYPLDEFQRSYRIGTEGETDRRICDAFDAVCSVLPQIGFDYDILPAQFLAEANVEDGRLRVGPEAFELVIVPVVQLADPVVSAKLRDFEQSGGRVINAHDVPGDGSDDLTALGKWLRGEISGSIAPDFQLESGGDSLSPIRCLHRVKDGHEVYFVSNTSAEECAATLSLLGKMSLEEWNLETGQRHPVPCSVRDGRTVIHQTFPPYGSAMFVSSDTPVATQPQTHASECAEVVELGPIWEFEPQALNGLFLDQWDFQMKVGGNTERFEYRTALECDDVPARLLLLLDDIEYRHAFMGGMDIWVKINDKIWRNPVFGCYLDHGFKTLDIAEAVRPGKNEIVLAIAHDAWSGEPKLLTSTPKLLGEFEVVDAQPGRIRKPTGKSHVGSWTEQGYPFYSGSATYSAGFEIASETHQARLVVEGVGDMFEAFVNGERAGVRPWRPWSLDITKHVHPGQNWLDLKITNSMRNFLEGEPKPSGLLGDVRLELR